MISAIGAKESTNCLTVPEVNAGPDERGRFGGGSGIKNELLFPVDGDVFAAAAQARD